MNSEIQKVFDCAEALYQKGDYESCLPQFKRIAETHPDSYPDVHNRLGVIFHAQGQVEAAVTCFENALNINSGYTEAALNLVVAYNDLGRFEEAEEVFHSASEQMGDGEEAANRSVMANRHVRLGDDYVRAGRLRDGLHEYRRALTLCPLYVDVISKVGDVLRRLGRMDDALRVFARAKELNPKFSQPYVHAGQIYFKQGFLDVAMMEWQQALELDPSRRDAEAYLATVRRALLQQ